MNIKQELVKLKAEQIKLLNKIEELEAKTNNPLDCFYGEGWYHFYNGEVRHSCSAASQTDYSNIRKKEAAEKALPLVQVQRALVNFKCEHDPVFEWGEENWVIGFDRDSNWNLVLDLYAYQALQVAGAVWFSTRELAESALDMLKRRKLI